MSKDERIKDREQEKLLLIATVEDLLRHEIALREQADLVFPSQFTREWPDASDPEGKAVTFTFEGPVQNIYSKLIVRLSRSEFFSKRDMWKNAALFSAKIGGTCGVLMNQLEDGRAEITLFFDTRASEETRFQFEEYISNYLQRQALAEGLYRRRIFVCSDSSCGEAITDRQAKKRRELGHKSINCPVCGTEISLLDREERLTVNLSSATSEIDDLDGTSNEAGQTSSAISEIDRIADVRREQETANIILQGKVATADFDVFLAHNSKDKAQVKAIAEALRQRGLNPWLDKERIPPGQWFQDVIQQTISQVKSAAIIIGPTGIGKWQSIELKSFIAQCVEADLPVIPVLLPKVKAIPQNLLFLKELNCVHFEDSIDDPEIIDQLEWGITGKHPRRLST